MPTGPSAKRTGPSVFNAFLPLVRRLITPLPQEPKLTAGLDLGTSSLKLLVLGPRHRQGLRPLVAQHMLATPQGRQDGVPDLIKQALSQIKVPLKTVNIAMSGPLVIMRVVEMPFLKPQEMRQAIPFEAQRFLPFPIQEVALDGAILGPTSEGGKVWVLIVACKKELIERRLEQLKQAGLHANLVDVDSLAMVGAFLSTNDGERASTLIDVGAQVTNLAIISRRTPYLIRDIPWGAEKFCQDVAGQVSLDAAAVTKAVVDGSVPAEWGAAIKSACETLVNELQLSFDFFENRLGQPPEDIVVTGGLSHSASFVDALRSHVTQTLRTWSPLPDLPRHFTVAYGLAMRAQ